MDKIFTDESGRKYKLAPIEDFNSAYKDYVVVEQGNSFVHSMFTIDTARKMSDDPIVLWGALFHDVGKGQPDIDEKGNLIFHGHEEKGAELTNKILQRLKFSNDDREIIVKIVAEHMRIKKAPQMRKAKLRKMLALGYIDQLLAVSVADSNSSIHEDFLEGKGKLQYAEFIKNYKEEMKDEPMLPKHLINGDDLISMGFKPGPRMGEILDIIFETQLEELTFTREEALDMAREMK